MIRALLLALLLLARGAGGTVIYMTGFEDSDTGTTTSMDVFSAAETDLANSEDSDLAITTDRDHNAANGGHGTGAKSLRVDLTTGESRIYTPPVTFSTNQLCASTATHLPSAPGAEWTYLEMRMGANRGVYARFTTSGTVKLYYATTGTVLGESGTVLRAKTCSGDAFRGCTVNGDCVSPQTCVSCTANTSVGCHMPIIEVCQANTFDPGGNLVTGNLYVNGVQEITGTPTAAANLAAITEVRLGGPETEAATRGAYLDDLVLATGTRTGAGWVATAIPVANGAVQWTAPSCDVSTNWQCLNDWSIGGAYDDSSNSGTTRATAAGKTDYILLSAIVPGDAAVDAVAYVMAGKTSGGPGTYNYETALLTCTSAASCVPGPVLSGSTAEATSHKLLAYDVATTAPGVTPSWNATTLSQLGLRYKALTSELRMGAVLAYAHGVLPDEPLARNLRDHNGDGIISWAGAGDSICAATNQQTCQGGQDQGKSCAQDFACSWSIAAGVGDRPVGGCTSNTQCRTCTARRDDSPTGAGFECVDNTWCGSSQTCNTGAGVCSVNTNVPCATDSECISLGTCDSTATCDDACVGGTCPSITGWPGGMVGGIDVDVLVACGLGNEPSWNLVANRVDGILAGNHATCLAIVGSGSCGCDSDDDCGTSGHCSAGGLCDAGDSTRVVCTSVAQCASPFACRFPAPDGLVVLSSANDFTPAPVHGTPKGTIGWKSAANCSEPWSLTSAYSDGEACDPGVSLTLCNEDSDCAGISPTSTCVGVVRSRGDLPCIKDALGSVAGSSCAAGACECSAASYACRSTADCVDGLTCSVDTPAAQRWLGYCQCSADAQCGNTSIWKCVNSMCRRKGTSDATCSSPTRAGSYDAGTGSCFGVCTMPCDRFTCSTDADCPVKAYPNAIPGPVTYRGDCVAGRCKNCGPEPCSRDPDAFPAHARWAEPFLRYGMDYQFQKIQAKIDAMPDVEQDGRPLLIPVTQPEYSKLVQCPISGGTGACARGEKQAPFNDGCGTQQNAVPDWGYGAIMSTRLLQLFPHVVDMRTVMARLRCRDLGLDESCGLHSDGVHLRPAGAALMGRTITNVVSVINACVTGAAPFQVYQRYCRDPTGAQDWATTPNNGMCATTADCSGGKTCVPRLCLSATSALDDTAAGCPGAAICNLE